MGTQSNTDVGTDNLHEVLEIKDKGTENSIGSKTPNADLMTKSESLYFDTSEYFKTRDTTESFKNNENIPENENAEKNQKIIFNVTEFVPDRQMLLTNVSSTSNTDVTQDSLENVTEVVENVLKTTSTAPDTTINTNIEERDEEEKEKE